MNVPPQLFVLLRAFHGLTQPRFGERLGLSASQVSRLESGRQLMGVDQWGACEVACAWGSPRAGETRPAYILVAPAMRTSRIVIRAIGDPVDARDAADDGVVGVFTDWLLAFKVAAVIDVLAPYAVVPFPLWAERLERGWDPPLAKAAIVEHGRAPTPAVSAFAAGRTVAAGEHVSRLVHVHTTAALARGADASWPLEPGERPVDHPA